MAMQRVDPVAAMSQWNSVARKVYLTVATILKFRMSCCDCVSVASRRSVAMQVSFLLAQGAV